MEEKMFNSLKKQKKIILPFLFFFLFSQNLFARPDFKKVCDAVYLAEGGAKAGKPFGVLSVPCGGYRDCRAVCLKSAENNFKRWEKSDKSKTYLELFRDRWAPLKAKNDPNGLNKNWLRLVQYFYVQD